MWLTYINHNTLFFLIIFLLKLRSRHMFQDVLLIGLTQVFSTDTNTRHKSIYYRPAVENPKRKIKPKAILPFHFVCHNFRLNSIHFSHNSLIAHPSSDPNRKTLVFSNIYYVSTFNSKSSAEIHVTLEASDVRHKGWILIRPMKGEVRPVDRKSANHNGSFVLRWHQTMHNGLCCAITGRLFTLQSRLTTSYQHFKAYEIALHRPNLKNTQFILFMSSEISVRNIFAGAWHHCFNMLIEYERIHIRSSVLLLNLFFDRSVFIYEGKPYRRTLFDYMINGRQLLEHYIAEKV